MVSIYVNGFGEAVMLIVLRGSYSYSSGNNPLV